jgi:hypothetical protein
MTLPVTCHAQNTILVDMFRTYPYFEMRTQTGRIPPQGAEALPGGEWVNKVTDNDRLLRAVLASATRAADVDAARGVVCGVHRHPGTGRRRSPRRTASITSSRATPGRHRRCALGQRA